MTQPVPMRPSADSGVTLTANDRKWLFNTLSTISERCGTSVDELLVAARAEWRDRPASGGKRAGAGRPSRDWIALTGHSLLELPLRLVIERQVTTMRTGVAPTDREILAANLPPGDPAWVEKMYDAFQHAVKKPAKSAIKEAAQRRASRRAIRAA